MYRKDATGVNVMENYIYGKNSIIEALESEQREFNKILISNTSRFDEKIEKIKQLAKSRGIVFQFVDKEKLNQIVNDGRHQGIIAQLSPINYVDLDDFLENNKKQHSPFSSLFGKNSRRRSEILSEYRRQGDEICRQKPPSAFC